MITRQKITSAGTSVKQLPAILGRVKRHCPEALEGVREILDYGGGKYDLLSKALAYMNIVGIVYDPFNRSAEHNDCVVSGFEHQPAPVAFCSNVLNVIREPGARVDALEKIDDLLAPGGKAFFTVYEGDRSSHGKKTSKGWQAHKPTKSYLREIRKVFLKAEIVGGKLIVASNCA